jgi:hypothetical protein
LAQVVGKGASQKLFRVIPANNSNLRALSAAPTLLLHQMCKPEQLINLQSVRSVKIPVMSSQQLTVQQPLMVPFQQQQQQQQHSQIVKKEQLDNQSLIESLLQAAEIKQEPLEQIKVEPSESRSPTNQKRALGFYFYTHTCTVLICFKLFKFCFSCFSSIFSESCPKEIVKVFRR